MKKAIQLSYKNAQDAIGLFNSDQSNIEKSVDLSERIAVAYNNGNKPLICGNGGSICDALHFAEELTGRYRKNRRALPAIAIADPGHLTCVANDFGYDDVFSRGVEAHGKPGDVFIGLSTSGNSENIIRAVAKAKEMGLYTVGLLGKDGGKLKRVCDTEFIIPGETADRIQEVHMMILHVLIEGIERVLFPELY